MVLADVVAAAVKNFCRALAGGAAAVVVCRAVTNDFPALPGSRETGPAKGEEPRGFLEVVKGTAKLRLDDQEGEGTFAGGGPPVEDSVVTIEPGSGEKRSAATPDLPEEFSSQSSKPGGHR